ncbi:TetR/AcrR family transcriptional regulator [Sphingopyxis sp. 550A]
MARQRNFDRNEALLAAMRAFWRHGYEATSLADLLGATGLSKSSLYDTFGNKRDLFLESFEAYRVERMRMLRGYLASGETAFASIEAFFLLVLQHARDEERPFGCMSCNEAVELGPHDAEIQQLIARDFAGMREAFADAIDRGRDDGSIASVQPTQVLADYLTVNHQGLQIMARSRVDIGWLENSVSVMLASLKT